MNETKSLSIEEIVANNIKLYIKAIGKTNKWVYERAGISKPAFYNLLKGSGDVNGAIHRLNRVFRISDPTYFYKQEFNVPATIQQLHSAPTLTEQAAANFHATGSPGAMEDTLDTLEEIITMLDVLHALREVE